MTKLTALFLTSKGWIGFSCFARESEGGAVQQIFESAIDSVQLTKDMTYSPPDFGRINGLQTLMFFGVGGVSVVIILAFVRRIMLRNAEKMRTSQS